MTKEEIRIAIHKIAKESAEGIEKAWKFENIEPESSIRVRYVIVGESGVKYNPRDAQVVTQG